MNHPYILEAERRGLPEGAEPEEKTILQTVELTGVVRCSICGDRQRGITREGHDICVLCLEDPVETIVGLLNERERR